MGHVQPILFYLQFGLCLDNMTMATGHMAWNRTHKYPMPTLVTLLGSTWVIVELFWPFLDLVQPVWLCFQYGLCLDNMTVATGHIALNGTHKCPMPTHCITASLIFNEMLHIGVETGLRGFCNITIAALQVLH